MLILLHTTAINCGKKSSVIVYKQETYKTANPNNPLHVAAAQGNIEEVQRLLATTGNINEKDINGYTPLHLAVTNGHVEVMKLLLTVTDIKVNEKNSDRSTPLHWAANIGHVEVVKLLPSSDWN